MKCDELEFERLGDANKTYPASTLVIRKQFVDAAIDELKAEIKRRNKKYAFALSILERYKSLSDTQTALDNKDLYDIYSKRSEIHYKRANKWAKIYRKLKGEI